MIGYRAMPFSARLVRPIENRHSNLFDLPSASGQPGVRAQKIFVIKQSRRLRSTNGADKTIRSILIFDNHPDSLRLVSRLRVRPNVDLVAARRAHPAHLMFALLLMLALSIAMFWPLIVRCHSLWRGSDQYISGGITKSRKRAMVMKHRGSDGETWKQKI